MELDVPRSLKAACLLARVCLATEEHVPFTVGEQGLVVGAGGVGYEGVGLGAVDFLGGGLMLVRGLLRDLALQQGVEVVEVARLVELFASAADACGFVEVSA